MSDFTELLKSYSDEDLLRYAYYDAGKDCSDIDDLDNRISKIEDEIISRKLPNAGLLTKRMEIIERYKNAGDKANELFGNLRIVAIPHQNAAIDFETYKKLTAPYDRLWHTKPKAKSLLDQKYGMTLPDDYYWGENEEIMYGDPDDPDDSIEVFPSATKISEIRINIDTNEITVVFSVWIDDHFVNVESSSAAAFSNDVLKRMANVGMVFNPRTSKKIQTEYLYAYHKQFKEVIPKVQQIGKIGWVNDEYNSFVPFSTEYSYSKADIYPNEFKSIINPKGELQDWIDLIAPYRDENHVPLRLIIAASFASVLAKPLSGLCFFLHIWGPSGQGKSVALMTAASVWADSDLSSNKFIKSFSATKAGLELAAQFCGNLPLCIDELQTHVTPGHDNCDDLVYALAEGSPRQRGTSSGGLKRDQGSWLNTIITTGEQPINSTDSMAGSLNRVIDVHFTGALIEEDKLAISAYCEKLKMYYGTAGIAFIEKLIEEGGMDKARAIYKEYLSQLASEATGKQASSASLILTADKLVSEWLFGDENNLTVDDIIPYLKKESDLQINEKVHEQVIQYIVSHAQSFNAESKSISSGRRCKTKDGTIYYAFFREVLEVIVNDAGGNLTNYIEWAKNNNKLVFDKGRNYKLVKFKFTTDAKSDEKDEESLRCYGIVINKSDGSVNEQKQFI